MDLQFQPTVPTGEVIATHLGTSSDSANRLTDKDIGKAVKLAGDDNYVLCSDGNEIEGILLAVEPGTIDDGWAYGSVQKGGRVIAINKGAGSIAVGKYVVAASQAAVGTPNATGGNNFDPCPQVKEGVAADVGDIGGGTEPTFASPAVYMWRVISLLGGTGAADSAILIEKQ